MKKLLILLLALILSFTCLSVAFADEGDLLVLGNPSSIKCFESISIAGEEATVEGSNISWETANRYEQAEIIISEITEGLTWKLFRGEEEVLSQSSFASSKSIIKGLNSGENNFTLSFFDEEGNVVRSYSLLLTNRGESGGDVFWEKWGQLILVFIFIVVFLLTIYIRYKRKQKMLKQQANARSHH